MPKGRPRKVEQAAELLQEWLKDGPVAQQEIMNLAEQHGISSRTMMTAKIEVGAGSEKRKDGWYWNVSV